MSVSACDKHTHTNCRNVAHLTCTVSPSSHPHHVLGTSAHLTTLLSLYQLRCLLYITGSYLLNYPLHYCTSGYIVITCMCLYMIFILINQTMLVRLHGCRRLNAVYEDEWLVVNHTINRVWMCPAFHSTSWPCMGRKRTLAGTLDSVMAIVEETL